MDTLKTNPQKWWSTAKETIGINKNKKIPTLVSEDGTLHTEEKDKANAFNEYFTGVQCIQNEPDPTELPELPDGPNLPHIDEIVATHQDVKDLLSTLDPNKAYGPDDISPRALKEAAPAIVNSIT